jgi:hypothetical protein
MKTYTQIKKIFQKYVLRAFFFQISLAPSVLLKSCGSKLQPLSLLKDVRVVSAQFYVEENAARNFPSATEIPPQNCQQWKDSKTYCQQYPVRPTTKSFLKFTLISPPNINPSFNVENLTQTKVLSPGGATGARISSNAQTEQTAVTRFSLVKNESLSRLVQQTPMRIEELVYEFTTPTATDLLSDALDNSTLSLPIFDLRYNSKGNETEAGFVNFTILPDASDEQFWNGITSSEQTQNNPQQVLALRAQSKTNLPPQIGTLSPGQNSSLGEKATFEFSIARPDTDENAKSRVQWFTTRGEFTNDGSKKTTWKSKDSGDVSVFAVIRDLQGGADTVYGNYKQ